MAVDITLAVTYFGILLGFGVLIANILQKAKIPDSFFLIVLGLVLGPTLFVHPAVTSVVDIVLVDVEAMGIIPDFIRLLAIILIIFTGAFSLRMSVFKEQSDISLKLSVLGPILTTIILGLAAYVIFGINPVFSLLLGAILSGTGEAVIFSFKTTLSKYTKAYTILFTESILNSPIVVLLPLLFLSVLNIESGGLIEPLKYLSQFWQLVAAGVGTGLIIGFGVSKLFGHMVKEYAPLLLFSIALITFALAENVGGSGFIAAAVCGLIVGNMTFREKSEVKIFDDHISNMFRISVFTLFGAQVALFFSFQDFLLIILFFAVTMLSRIPIVMAFLGKERKTLSRREKLLLTFVAPKGIEAAATTPIVAAALLAVGQVAIASKLVNIVVVVVLLSILVSSVIGTVISRNPPQGVKTAQAAAAPDEDRNMVEIRSSGIKRKRGP